MKILREDDCTIFCNPLMPCALIGALLGILLVALAAVHQ